MCVNEGPAVAWISNSKFRMEHSWWTEQWWQLWLWVVLLAFFEKTGNGSLCKRNYIPPFCRRTHNDTDDDVNEIESAWALQYFFFFFNAFTDLKLKRFSPSQTQLGWELFLCKRADVEAEFSHQSHSGCQHTHHLQQGVTTSADPFQEFLLLII